MTKAELCQALSNAIDELRKTIHTLKGDDLELVYHAGRTIATGSKSAQPG